MESLSKRETAVITTIGLAVALSAVGHYAKADDLLTFSASTLALTGLAWIVSFSTEQVGERFGPAITGVMQSTLGNLPEFFVVLFALSAGEVVVAKTSIVGSLFANALLVLGLVIVAGAAHANDGVMRFKRRLPNDASTLLLLALFIIVLVGLTPHSNPASRHIETISVIAAACILAVYVAWVIPYLRSDTGSRSASPSLPLALSASLLAASGTGSAFVSDWFVGALRPTIDTLHLSADFAGIVIVAIAGNAVENVTGIVLAFKGKSDLAISVVKNSVAQVAAFLFPLLVIVSTAFFDTSLTFSLAPIYIGALLLTAVVVWQITGDGRAAAFEGWALVALYVILAVFALYQ